MDTFLSWCGGDEGLAFLDEEGLEGGLDLGGLVWG